MTAPILKPQAAAGYSRWQRALADAVRDLDELAGLLDLAPAALARIADNDASFPLLVPRGYVARMQRGRLDDPLLRQVLPRRAERARVAGFGDDPVGERGLAEAGVLQKYAARALLITTGACPVHCRYCFRREFPYDEQLAARGDWRPALEELAARTDLREAILSGGDPLSLSTRRLRELLGRLAAIEHIDTVRIHTRFPIVLPERVDRELMACLSDFPRKLVVVVHCNHAQELAPPVADALGALRPRVDLLLNQAVLLTGVNDDADALEALSRQLFAYGVLPYYLHVLDKVTGTAHFEVEATRARELCDVLRARLPGYLVPKLVRESAGALSKTPL